MNISFLDIAVVAVILFFALKGYFSGLVKTCFSFVPHIGAVLAAYIVSPAVSAFLRSTFLYGMMKSGVRNALGIDALIENAAMETQKNIIESLKLPSFLTEALLENNNPVVYKILNVSEIGDYISGYIANVCINVLSAALIFATVYILLKVVLSALDLVAHLPVINFLNSSGGMAAGALYGLLIIWIASTVLVLFYSNALFAPVFEALEKSRAALFLYENNILLFLVLKIFT